MATQKVEREMAIQAVEQYLDDEGLPITTKKAVGPKELRIVESQRLGSGSLTQSTFVGRQREMGKLKGVLEDALSGQGQLLMLVGEPGIGKTRTAQELAAYAETRGAQILWGWCYEEEGAPPFWPWVQLLRAYVQQRDPEQLQLEMGPGAADIAEVISEVRGKLPGLEPPLALQLEQARFRLFDSISTFLKNAAQSQPLMLVLDDLHWADKPSLLLLQFLARQLGESHLLVVGCYRDLELSRQHPLSEALAQLSRLPVFQRELLLGMSQEDSGQFIEMTAGMWPSPQLLETIHAHTEGNPFFLKEMTRLLSEQGKLMTAEIGGPEGIIMPQGVREVIGQRLNRLSESCHETLTIASIIGREFDFRLLRILTDEDTDEQLLGVIDEALASRLVEELPGGRERYRFSHSLIQQTLAEELSSSRKVRWHARIGEVLEELYGVDGEAHAAELVYHFAKAEPVLGPEKLVYYSLLAGEGALATYAYEEALAHFQQGLVAMEGRPLDAETADLLFGLGRAQATTLQWHQMHEAYISLNRAFDCYVELGAIPRALAVAEYPVYITAGHTGAARLIARALPLIPPESHQAGYLLARYGAALGVQEVDYARATEALQQAVTIARHQQDSILELWALTYGAVLDVHHFQWSETLRKNRQATQLARRIGEPLAEVWARYWAAHSSHVLGDLSSATHQAKVGLAIAEQLRDCNCLSVMLLSNALVSELQGNWAAARHYSDRGLAVAPSDQRLIGHRAVLEYQVGEFSQSEAYLRQLLDSILQTPPGPTMPYAIQALVIPVVAQISGIADRLDAAEAATQAVLSAQSATPLVAKLARTGLALIVLLRRDIEAARELYDALVSQRGTMSSLFIADDRLLGLLATTQGWLDQAMVHFEDALVFCRQAGYRPELAWTCYDCAEVLLQRGHPGDRTRAMSLLEDSFAISSELGMRPLLERVQPLQERVALRPGSVPVYPDGLSQREVEVLRLIALGKSNRDISEELVISLRTVAHHVTSILNKTGASNRTEAAAYAARHGLVSW
jgi:DNA-binding CsgD family transcriptional regulator/tetratricopeptide (TPR) repeat protein